MTRTERQHTIAKNAADLLIQNGYRVFVYEKEKECFNWFYYGDSNNVAYLQIDRLTEEVQISTVNKPNKHTGTGYIIGGINPDNIEDYKTGFVFAPDWASSKDLPHIRKYTGVVEKINSEQVLKYVEYTGTV